MDIGEIDSPDTYEQYAATAKIARQAVQNLTYRIDEMQEYLSSGAAPEGERASIEAAKRQYIDRRNKYKEFVRKLDKALAESEYLTADSVFNIAQHAIMTGDIDWESSDVRAADIKARRERDVATIRSRMQEVLGGDKSRPLTLDELANILDTDGLKQTMTQRYQVGREIYNRMRHLTEEQQDLERRREELEGLNEKEGTTNERSFELGQIYKRQLDIEQYLKNAERVSRMYFDSGSALSMKDILSGKDGGKLPLVVMNEVFAMLQEAEAQLSAKGKSTNRAGWKNGLDEAHRVIESATGEFAPIFNALYISPVMKANAEIGREFGEIEQRLKDSGITKKNEVIAFRYAEGKITEEQFRTMIPDAKEREAVLRGLDVYRDVYDKLFDRVNAALKRNGLDQIPYRQKYFHHMRETQGLIAKAASMLGIHIDDDTLPTSLAGKTDELKPRHNYMSAAEERHGDETTYTLHYNTASYAQAALRVIHQTDNITRLRQLEGFSDKTVNKAAVNAGIRQYADLSRSGESTKDGRKQAYSSLVEWLSNYTDSVAGKKVGYMDRAVAGALGRNALQVVSGLTSLRGSAITGFNIKSALSNGLSIATAASVAPKETMAALGEAYDAFFKMHDWRDFEASSDFLSSRFSGGVVSDQLIERYKQTGQVPAEIVDRFAAHVAVRSLYKAGRNRGWGHEVAMKFADETALRMMASRNKGEGSNYTNSIVMGAALQFSREGINNIQFLMHDLPRFHNGDPKKVLASLIGLNILNWLYNTIFGTNTAPEVISPTMESVREWDKEKTVGANVLNTLGNYASALNPTNLGTGGYNDSAVENIPVVSGAKEVLEGAKSVISGDGFETLASAALGFIPGSTAIDRFVTGAGDLTRGYSVDKDGNIRYVLHTDEFSGESVWDFIAAPLFGSTATTEGRKWKENGFDTMTKSMTEAFHDQTALGQTNMEAYSTVTGYAETKDSRNVSGMDLPDWFTDQGDDPYIARAASAFNAGEISRPKDPPNSLSDSYGVSHDLTDEDKQRYAELYAEYYRNQIIMAGDGDLSGVADAAKDLADVAFKNEKGW